MPLNDYFFRTPASIKRYDTLEISHPSFSRVYRLVRNASLAGLTATNETGAQFLYSYYPMQITRNGQPQNLDQSISVSFGDLGSTLAHELDNVVASDSTLSYPVVKYRSWRSDDLSKPLDGPETYQIVTNSFKKDASTFDITAPHLNVNGTGRVYTTDDFPMLGGFS